MNPLAGLRLVLAEIRSHKLRSGLTILGVVFGVATFIALFALLAGAQETSKVFLREVGGLEKVAVFDKDLEQSDLASGRARRSEGRMLSDAQALCEKAGLAGTVSPECEMRTQLRFGGKETWCAVQGVTPAILTINRYRVGRGRFICDLDQRRFNKVCVLGTKTSEDLFGGQDPMGQFVVISGSPYKVVGILQSSVLMTGQRNALEWKNKICYIPILSMIRRFKGSEKLTWLNLEIRDTSRIAQTLDQVRNILLRLHGVEDFRFDTREEWASQMQKSDIMWKIMLGVIGGICLLTGGVGIMNIMLASVNERTREIGIRRALGARRRDILFQFLQETVLLSVLGGFIGVFLGVGLALGFTLLPEQRAIISAGPMALAFSFSIAVGLFFGLYPALRAARMDPIEALRYE